ncbi:MAG: hypothetical protein FVQ06_08725, partial [candidate division NC10 bacterium]|nr:hypothetical protein [candidate division NC10 bacterium]
MPMRARMSVRPGMAKVTAVIFVCLLAIFAVPVVHAGHVPDPDLNNDGVVDHADLEIIKGSVGKRCGESGFNELADINHDCLVDLFDLVFVARAFGQSGFPTEEQDTTPPVVTITAPPDQSLLNATPIAVSGTVDDDTATITVNGIQATVSAGTFTAAGVPLQQGVNTLTATATDPAANVGTASIQVTLDTTAPQVTIASPVDGSTLNTNTPLIRITYADPAGAGLDLQSLVVQINGVDQTSLFTKGATEATAQLTSATALAEGSNTIQAQINDQAGNAASATANVTVVTVPVTPAGFGVVLGQVVDATTGQPLAGTTVKALGSTSEVLTDGQGRFELPAPAGNRAPIYFNKGGYVDAKAFAVVEAGRESTVGTVRLEPFDQVATRIDSNGGSHTDSTGTVQVIFPAGAVGTAIDVTATVFPTADEFPLKVPEGQAYLAGVQFTPENLTFAQPVTVRMPNNLNLPPNTDVPFAFANHSDQNSNVVFFDPGMAQVSADGQFIEAQLSHFSCIALALPVLTERPPVLQESGDAPVENSQRKCCVPAGSRVGAQDGTLFLDQALPSTRTLGRANSPTLTYSSATADPHPLILTEALLDPAATTLPQQVRWQLRAGPLEEERTFIPQPGTSRYAFSWDPRDSSGNLLPTGSHRVEVILSNDYQGTLATTSSFGGPPIRDLGIPVPGLTPQSVRPNARIIIHNRQQSPFGAGWGLQGLQRLHPQPEGAVITDGDGTALTFRTIPLLYASVSPGITTFGGLSAIDPQTGDVQSVFPTVIQPDAVTTSPAGDLVFVVGGSGIHFIDTRTQEEVHRINTIAFSQGVAVSPDGSTLFVVASKPSIVAIIDIPTRQVLSTLPLSGIGVGVALSQDGRLAYVAQQFTNDVTIIDTQTLSLVATIPLGAQVTQGSMVLSGDGRTLFVAVATGVAVIDTTTNSLQTTLSLG